MVAKAFCLFYSKTKIAEKHLESQKQFSDLYTSIVITLQYHNCIKNHLMNFPIPSFNELVACVLCVFLAHIFDGWGENVVNKIKKNESESCIVCKARVMN